MVQNLEVTIDIARVATHKIDKQRCRYQSVPFNRFDDRKASARQSPARKPRLGLGIAAEFAKSLLSLCVLHSFCFRSKFGDVISFPYPLPDRLSAGSNRFGSARSDSGGQAIAQRPRSGQRSRARPLGRSAIAEARKRIGAGGEQGSGSQCLCGI